MLTTDRILVSNPQAAIFGLVQALKGDGVERLITALVFPNARTEAAVADGVYRFGHDVSFRFVLPSPGPRQSKGKGRMADYLGCVRF